jgi:hypothetical protein
MLDDECEDDLATVVNEPPLIRRITGTQLLYKLLRFCILRQNKEV